MKYVLACLILCLPVLLIGCDPVETELTVYADGSGRMTQKVKLTADAVELLTQVGRNSGWEPVLTKSGAEKWNVDNADSGINVESFNAVQGADGSLAIEYTVIFKSLERFAHSVWGQPLQLSVTEIEEGREIRFDDPLKFLAFAGAGAGPEAFKNAPEPDDPGYLEQQAALQLLQSVSSELASRTTLKAPVQIRSAEGMSVSEDSRAATLTFSGLRDRKALTAWLAADSPKVTIEPIAVAAFSAPDIFSPPGEMGMAERTLEIDGKEWRLTLSNIQHSRNRTMSFLEGGGPRVNANISLQYQLWGPEDTVLIDGYRLFPNYNNNLAGRITAIQDGDGQPMTANINFSPNYSYRFGRPRGEQNRNQPVANISINIQNPPEDIKSLSLIEGYATFYRAQPGSMTLRPLSAHLGKAVDLNLMAVTFGEIKDNTISVQIAWKTGNTGNIEEYLNFYDGNGKQLSRHGTNSSGGGYNVYNYQITFGENIPPDAYAEIRYPKRIEALKVPFSFKDISMPQ